MRKKLALIALLIIMVSVFILNSRQLVKYIVERDEVIEWQSYSEEELII